MVDMGLAWLFALLLVAIVAMLAILVVRAFVGLRPGSVEDAVAVASAAGRLDKPHGRSTARQILDQRFARGELTADAYREGLRVLGEDR
ncbi:SHOCT domain-containing protein [Arthrobacter sp. NPDC055138]|jgi:putative membrane protein